MSKDLLSALLDGECNAEELDRLLDACGQSESLRRSWSRMCAARDARDGVQLWRGGDDFCAGVMVRLDEQDANPRVVPLFRQRARAYWKPLTGIAAAASLAAVAILLNPLAPRDGVSVAVSDGATGSAMNPGAERVAVGGFGQPVSAPVAASAEAPMDDEMRNLLLEHSSSVAGRGVGATLSYARFAAHTVVDPGMQSINFEVTDGAAGAPR